MKLLLDENVPAPMTLTVKTLPRRSHDVQHVIDIPGWSGTKDLQLYAKAKEAGFQLVVTNDAKQMNRRSEVEAICKSGALPCPVPPPPERTGRTRPRHGDRVRRTAVRTAGTGGCRWAALGDLEGHRPWT